MHRASSQLVYGFLGCRRSANYWGPTLLKHANISGVSAPSPSQLGQVVRLEELIKKTQKEVTEIWLGYHADAKGGRIGSILSSEEYGTFLQRVKESPMFVLPLAKPAGYETLLVQCQLPFVLITGLEEFKRHGESAPPYLTLTHYTELRDSHGVVLVRGDVIHEKGVTLQEARTAMELVRAFYCGEDGYPLVYTFNHHPSKFDFNELLRRLNLAT